MSLVISACATPLVPVRGSADAFPVRRIYCVGRNYAEHQIEMGGTGREAPFFFMKPADAVVPVAEGQTGTLPYPTLTADFHHEVELVVAIGQGGANIPAAQALSHVWGYAVGLDMTRRDLQAQAKKAGRPWSISKGFDASAPIGALTPAAQVPGIASAAIELRVNGQPRQASRIDKMIWNVAEIIEHLSAAWTLAPGDLIFTGTPEGVAAVVRGDVLEARVEGLAPLALKVA
ncbi:fumarylacetoacetate hydrolase family protein [Caldimonas sp. KR1-144]|uniref:fumarylacetoacetate hydrolase family protein n=1 Tax=Caldimonas sp. KR1-144 TaxID=3400911 RepID=UPI003BFC86D6